MDPLPGPVALNSEPKVNADLSDRRIQKPMHDAGVGGVWCAQHRHFLQLGPGARRRKRKESLDQRPTSRDH